MRSPPKSNYSVLHVDFANERLPSCHENLTFLVHLGHSLDVLISLSPFESHWTDILGSYGDFH